MPHQRLSNRWSTRLPIAAILSCSILDNDETDGLDLKWIANESVVRCCSMQNILENFMYYFYVLCVTLFCRILTLCYLLNTKLKHPQNKNVAYGHAFWWHQQITRLWGDSIQYFKLSKFASIINLWWYQAQHDQHPRNETTLFSVHL